MPEHGITYDLVITDEPAPKKVTFNDFAVNDLTVTASDWSQVWTCRKCGHEVSEASPTDPNGSLCVKCGNIATADKMERFVVRYLWIDGRSSKSSGRWERRFTREAWDINFGDVQRVPELALAKVMMTEAEIEPAQHAYFTWTGIEWGSVDHVRSDSGGWAIVNKG